MEEIVLGEDDFTEGRLVIDDTVTWAAAAWLAISYVVGSLNEGIDIDNADLLKQTLSVAPDEVLEVVLAERLAFKEQNNEEATSG